LGRLVRYGSALGARSEPAGSRAPFKCAVFDVPNVPFVFRFDCNSSRSFGIFSAVDLHCKPVDFLARYTKSRFQYSYTILD
jgi:hypothetical protein